MTDQANFKAGRPDVRHTGGLSRQGSVRKRGPGRTEGAFWQQHQQGRVLQKRVRPMQGSAPGFRQNLRLNAIIKKRRWRCRLAPNNGIGSVTPCSTVSWTPRTMATNRLRQFQGGTWKGHYAPPFAIGRVIKALNKARTRPRQVTHERYDLSEIDFGSPHTRKTKEEPLMRAAGAKQR